MISSSFAHISAKIPNINQKLLAVNRGCGFGCLVCHGVLPRCWECLSGQVWGSLTISSVARHLKSQIAGLEILKSIDQDRLGRAMLRMASVVAESTAMMRLHLTCRRKTETLCFVVFASPDLSKNSCPMCGSECFCQSGRFFSLVSPVWGSHS